MKLKKGTTKQYTNFIEKMEQTDKRELKFGLEWIAEIELAIESGKTIAECAKTLLVQKSERSGYGCHLEKWVDWLKEVWIYGNELNTWYLSGMESNSAATIHGLWVSKHARKRMHERFGLSRSAQDKMAKMVFKKGIEIEQTKGILHNHLARIINNTEESEKAVVKVYGDAVYIYKQQDNGFLLITVMKLPYQINKRTKTEVEYI